MIRRIRMHGKMVALIWLTRMTQDIRASAARCLLVARILICQMVRMSAPKMNVAENHHTYQSDKILIAVIVAPRGRGDGPISQVAIKDASDMDSCTITGL
ncbi:hypothetical protein EDB19DRAFT_1735101 [Suillus lakei]|nr:hypothetical protein EDB19DRAFT_1735101 [Suillus lakei]